jgi:hypothetical protein
MNFRGRTFINLFIYAMCMITFIASIVQLLQHIL